MCSLACAVVLVIGGSVCNAAAQSADLIFTAQVPEQSLPSTTGDPTPIIEERGLALWAGTASDFGVGASVAKAGWSLRSTVSMTTLPVEGRRRSTFQQVEIDRVLFANRFLSVGGGGGIRQEWDGTRLLIGRVLAAAPLGRSGMQGSLIFERATSSPSRRDAADMLASVGWTWPVSAALSLSIESIGQDLEGFWDPAEADGGAKLLVGPSVRARSLGGHWEAALTAGPVIHRLSTASNGEAAPTGRHFAAFVSGTWTPSLRR